MKNNVMIVVNYDESNKCIQLINNVSGFKSINKIIIVDNSKELNNDLMECESNLVHIIRNKKELGYAASLNKGIMYGLSIMEDFNAIISHPDIKISGESVIINLIEQLKGDIVCISPVVKEYGNNRYGFKLHNSHVDVLKNIPLIGRIYINKIDNYKEEELNQNVSIIGRVSGMFYILNVYSLRTMKMYDEHNFKYYEEEILSRKFERINKKVALLKTEYVTHMYNTDVKTKKEIINEFKLKRLSEIYYEKKYNKANIIQIGLLYIFFYMGLFGKKIKFLFK